MQRMTCHVIRACDTFRLPGYQGYSARRPCCQTSKAQSSVLGRCRPHHRNPCNGARRQLSTSRGRRCPIHRHPARSRRRASHICAAAHHAVTAPQKGSPPPLPRPLMAR